MGDDQKGPPRPPRRLVAADGAGDDEATPVPAPASLGVSWKGAPHGPGGPLGNPGTADDRERVSPLPGPPGMPTGTQAPSSAPPEGASLPAGARAPAPAADDWRARMEEDMRALARVQFIATKGGSIPPPATTGPRHSMPVEAAIKGYKFSRGFMALIGLATLLAEYALRKYAAHIGQGSNTPLQLVLSWLFDANS